MRAAIVAVGSELLGTERLDTNSLTLAGHLERHGVALVEKAVVGDDEAAIAATLARLAAAVDLVLVTGGLGPTADDRTRAAAARAFDRELAEDPALVAVLERRFAAYGRRMAAANRRQAEAISGAEVLDNPRGTAPGQRIDVEGGAVFLFPGVPRELEGMIEDHLEPWLRSHAGGAAARRHSDTLRVACLPESEVEERLAPVYRAFGSQAVAVLASPGEVRVVLSAEGGADAGARLEAMREAARQALGAAVFGRGDDTLEATVGALLRRHGRTVVTAESCTGGQLGARLTRVAGSSAFFLGGVIAYSDALKTRLLGVAPELIAAHGAVSAPVARTMALAVRARCGGDYGVAITGIAGPGGGSEEKPVGTVFLAVAADGIGDGDVLARQVRFPGSRAMVRRQSTQLALELIRRHLLGASLGDVPPATLETKVDP